MRLFNWMNEEFHLKPGSGMNKRWRGNNELLWIYIHPNIFIHYLSATGEIFINGRKTKVTASKETIHQLVIQRLGLEDKILPYGQVDYMENGTKGVMVKNDIWCHDDNKYMERALLAIRKYIDDNWWQEVIDID